MRTKIFAWGLVCLFLIACNSPFAPEIKTANIELDGTLQRTYTSYGSPQFEGYVKNRGNGTGYNCMVEIQCFSDPNKTTIIDTAKGFPADLGNIDPGQRAYFEAIAFDCNSHEEIKSYSVDITWLDRD